jgi:thiamine biosynthesis lipoprotein
VRYGHILDPRSGWPARGLASATVVADACLVAGTLSTCAMLRGVNGGPWLDALGARAFYVGEDGRVGGSLAAAPPHRELRRVGAARAKGSLAALPDRTP